MPTTTIFVNNIEKVFNTKCDPDQLKFSASAVKLLSFKQETQSFIRVRYIYGKLSISTVTTPFHVKVCIEVTPHQHQMFT
jgi:hypothetical protein